MGSRPPRQPRVRSSGLDQREIFKRRALELVRKIHDKDKYAIFHEPVPLDEVPSYAKVITTPMDLGTVRENTNMGVYPSPTELRADLDLIWANCVKFNQPDTIYYKEAVRLRALAGKLFEEFLRYLERDGLPYGPRASSSGSKTPGGQLRAGASESAPNFVPLQTVGQRLQNIARARRKAVLDATANPKPSEAQRAATNAANALMPPPDKHQIYEGPYQRLRRFPNAHHAALFPYVKGGNLERLVEPFPYAWQALGRSRRCSQQLAETNLSRNQREIEMRFAHQYQNFVTQSAPIARRLLATILDPLAVVEHDAAQLRANSSKNRSCPHERKVPDTVDVIPKGMATSAPKKRPRHGELQPSSAIVDNANASVKPALSPVPPPPSPDDLRELRDVLKTHNIDDSFLSGFLNSSQNPLPLTDSADSANPKDVEHESVRSSPEHMDVDSGSLEQNVTEEKKQPNPKPILSKSVDNIDSIPNQMDISVNVAKKQTPVVDNNFESIEASTLPSRLEDANEKLLDGTKREQITNNKDKEDEESIDSEADRDAKLDELLRANHETMQNVLRTRALKEMATGDARKDLEEAEGQYAEMLRRGISRATAVLPPQLLISKAKAGALLVDMAKETIKRHRKAEENSASAKKQKMDTSGHETGVGTIAEAQTKTTVQGSCATKAVTDRDTESGTEAAKNVTPNGHVEPNGVARNESGKSNVKAGGTLTTGKIVKDVSTKKVYST